MTDFLKKHTHFLLYFLIGCILTLPFLLKPHFDFDTYQLFHIGYDNYANIFMLSGRVITALFYYVFSILKVPYNFLAIVSVIGGNVFIALSCNTFEKMIKKLNPGKHLNDFLYIMTMTLLFFNFFMMEYFTFMESFIMCMAVYLFVLSIHAFLKNTCVGYARALCFAIAGMLCYQGAISIYIPLLAFLVYLQNQDKEFKTFIVDYLKKGIYAFLIYGICYITAFVIMKVYMANSGQVSLKDGTIDIFANLAEFRPMMSSAWKQLFGYFKPMYFYIALTLLILANAWKLISQKQYLPFIFFMFIICIFFLTPFIPNLFLPSNANYVSPRVMVAVPMVIGISILFYLCVYPKENHYLKYFIMTLLIIFNVINLLNYYTMMNDGLTKHEFDKEVVNEIYDRIHTYEIASGNTITKIAYAQDDSITYFYDLKTKNSFTYRLYAFPWAFEAAINGFSNKQDYQFEVLSDIEKNTLFGEYVNYSEFDDKQCIFDQDTLYLLLF